jgi:hypothetical protein
MRKNNIRITALALIILIPFLRPAYAPAQAGKAPHPVMAPLDQYLIPDEKAEIVLARSAAPASISDAAEVKVTVTLRRPDRPSFGRVARYPFGTNSRSINRLQLRADAFATNIPLLRQAGSVD